MRTLTALLSACALTLAVQAAPVPKGKPVDKPTTLTAAELRGKWAFEWNGRTGWIIFEDAERYAILLDDSPSHLWYGTYSVKGSTVTIVEWSLDKSSGNGPSGPQVFRLEYTLDKWPVMCGKSTQGYQFDAEQVPDATLPTKMHKRQPLPSGAKGEEDKP